MKESSTQRSLTLIVFLRHREADALDLSNCTAEQKKVLFNTAKLAFTSTTRSTEPVSSYQLLKSYTGRHTHNDYI